MSVGAVRRDFADRFFNCIQRTAAVVDSGRARVAEHHPELGHERPASLEIPEIRLTVERVITPLIERVAKFPIGGSSRSGPVWDRLCWEFRVACAAVRVVSTKLILVASTLFHDVESLSPPPAAPGSPLYLVAVDHAFLGSVDQRLGNKTARFLIQAETFLRPVVFYRLMLLRLDWVLISIRLLSVN